MGPGSADQHGEDGSAGGDGDDERIATTAWWNVFAILRRLRRAEGTEAGQELWAGGKAAADQKAVLQVRRLPAPPEPVPSPHGRVRLQELQQAWTRGEHVPLKDTGRGQQSLQVLRGHRPLEEGLHLARPHVRKMRKERAPPPGLQMPPQVTYQKVPKHPLRQPLHHRSRRSNRPRSSPRTRQLLWQCRRGKLGGITAAEGAARVSETRTLLRRCAPTRAATPKIRTRKREQGRMRPLRHQRRPSTAPSPKPPARQKGGLGKQDRAAILHFPSRINRR